VKKIFHVLAVMMLSGDLASAQAQPRPLATVYIECGECGDDYLREQLPFVNLVRDRMLADVGVLVTSLSTASGGQAYSIELLERIGLRRGDTVMANVRADATELERRGEVVRSIKVALLPFLRGTPAMAHLDVSYSPPGSGARTSTRGAGDPWRQWVFRMGGSGSFAGDDNFTHRSVDGSFSASRITESFKVALSVKGSYTREMYLLAEGDRARSERRAWSATSLTVKSLGDHLSFGLRGTAGSSIFENMQLQLRAMPAVEYDLFPYSEATQRQLVVRYAAGARMMRYVDTTVYGRLSESRPAHELSVLADIRQARGSLWGSAVASQYLHDRSKRRLTVEGGVDWRIVAGLSVNFSANYSQIRDQLNVPGAALSNEDRLLRLRELQSGHSASAGLGLSYTFGSVYSNVVNPRFRL
jgi:hypothetical protein